MGIRKAVAVLFAACLLCAHAAVAHAAQAARLVYGRSADAGTCPDEETLRSAVARRLGYDPFVAYATRIVVVEMHGGAPGYTGRIFVVDAGTVGGVREIASPGSDCRDLISAVALAISIAVDPAATIAETASPEAEPEPAIVPASEGSSPSGAESAPGTVDAAAVPSPTPSSPPERDEPRESARKALNPRAANRITWSAGGGVFLATGPAPSPDLGVALVAGITSQHWSLGVEPRAALPATSDVQNTPGKVKITVYGATLVPCYRYDDWFGCYVLDLARTTASGVSVDVSHSDHALWAAQGLRIAHRWRVGAGFSLGASADGLWAFTRTAFSIDGKVAFETPRLLARFGVDTRYDF